ncbi:initiator RepB protein [Lactobacillus gigeriorum DSM 23908 = CRBIP 24.85]|uniref:Initiator RepB protein n=2 Tax=Lactobacillus gigeriorum DSM 23908 = CRBIP 24.85 TaxID=1423751 RepID=A0ABR5PVV5_9LACO|nr:initiator RepB protein [Lactobacillus gigeriorum DSM 23908 = CRBIP 24.85]
MNVMATRKRPVQKIIKIDNRFNDDPIFEPIDSLPEINSNIFWLIAAQVKDQGGNRITLSPDQIKREVGYNSHISNKQIAKNVDDTFSRLLTIQLSKEEKDQKTGHINKIRENIFKRSVVDTDTLETSVEVSDSFLYLFNHLEHWTRFSITQYVRLHSNYSRKLFRLLKQWRTVGRKEYKIDDFRKRLQIPKSYRPTDIDRRVLSLCMEELCANFQNFKITKNYRKGVRGRKLDSYIFTWVPEKNNQQDVYYDSSIEDTNSVYYIKSNPYMTEEEKFRALDRFYGFTLGTSAEEYKEGHLHSYFLPNKLHKRTRRTVFHRSDLKSLTQYKHAQFAQLLAVYREVNKKGFLTPEDQEDMQLLQMGYEKSAMDRERDQISEKERLKNLENRALDLQKRREDEQFSLDFTNAGKDLNDSLSLFDVDNL